MPLIYIVMSHDFSFVEENIKDATCIIVVAPSLNHLKFDKEGYIPTSKHELGVAL